MKILLHSSKTIKPESSLVHKLTTPQFIDQALYLNEVLQNLDEIKLMDLMGISKGIASNVERQIAIWRNKAKGSPAALTFRGDIYSGLSANQWDKGDAVFAQNNLLILSGLYGLLKPFDEIKAYRLEMGHKLKLGGGLNLDKYWEQELANKLDARDSYVNLTSLEYFKVLKKQLSRSEVISPKFLTINEKTKLPTFVTVHAKIARGSFANWLIKNKITDLKEIINFDDLNYRYSESLSSEYEPVFVCQKFGGLGLSIRLK